ncbi:MAG: hypothetical protein ACJA0G_001307 [Kangiellaceae bacterium]|jgi:uncharacterized protein YbaP (TraB family)
MLPLSNRRAVATNHYGVRETELQCLSITNLPLVSTVILVKGISVCLPQYTFVTLTRSKNGKLKLRMIYASHSILTLQGVFMTKLLAHALLYLFMFAFFSTAMANAAPVFKITKDGDTIFIGGTFHLLTQSDYPLPEAFEKAYLQADEIYFETDINELDSPAFQRKFFDIILYKDGETLQSDLDKATYTRLVEYVKSRQLDPMQFNVLNPTGVMLTITIMEYQARGFVAQGVDKYYFERALEDNKTIGWFETPDEQLAVMDGFDNDDPNSLINYTLDEIKNIDETITGLHNSWRSGDMDTLVKLGIDSFEDYPGIYDLVLVDRNNSWMQKIEAMFGDKGTEFVLVGALHLPGKDGVLTQLEKKGYIVKQL